MGFCVRDRQESWSGLGMGRFPSVVMLIGVRKGRFLRLCQSP